ncbi:MAG: TIR domain-containing protein [Magnetococcales bacterium]|nr:TIR domain-containing protein [Magnetococcales bacterium]
MVDPQTFKYDVFLSHSAKDKAVVRALAERLQADGVRVWFDDWAIEPGDNIPHKIEEGLEQSRVLLLCMSKNAFDSEWARLESYTFRFRDPLNLERRFLPLRLDDTPAPGSLGQFAYLDWRNDVQRSASYEILLQTCRGVQAISISSPAKSQKPKLWKKVSLKIGTTELTSAAFSQDRKSLLTGDYAGKVRLWDVASGLMLRRFHGHSGAVWGVAWCPDKRLALSSSGGTSKNLLLWNLETGTCLKEFSGHTQDVTSVAWSWDGRLALSGSADTTVCLWDVETGHCLKTFSGHTNAVSSLAWRKDSRQFLTGGADATVRLWDVMSGRCQRVMEGHTGPLRFVAWSPDQRHAISGGKDITLRIWDVATGQCLGNFIGHKNTIWSAAWSDNQRFILSGSLDGEIRLWEVPFGRCIASIQAHKGFTMSVVWKQVQRYALSCNDRSEIIEWDLSSFLTAPGPEHPLPEAPVPEQKLYTNAKVLLVGESSAGKTGLAMRLAKKSWEPSDSTLGAWATQWDLPATPQDGVAREIWLWDFGGQADQRLIHQLYMDEAALAVLVFDGQKENLLDTLGQWNRDLTRAARTPHFAKLLVLGRLDAGVLRISRDQMEAFVRERGFCGYLETSAKTGQGCAELEKAIRQAIRWEEIPARTSPRIFQLLKQGILALKDQGRALIRFNELREILTLRLSGEATFTDAELKTVITLLVGPGVVLELTFGSFILLQPERINAYAQAVIQTMREDPLERGCILRDTVLNGDLTYHAAMARLPEAERDDERILLLAMVQLLLERGLCWKELQTDQGALLIFPSYYRRERPDQADHPATLMSYRFNGFLDEIYATLVVRLHHLQAFRRGGLWRYAADFQTQGSKKQLGIRMNRLGEGTGEIQVYFDPDIEIGEKIIFSLYVHHHLHQHATEVVRLRHYVCACGETVENREVARKRLEAGKMDILCVNCERRVPLWDDMEHLFAVPELKQSVHEWEERSRIVLDNESKERTLVGEVIATVALAGQISREFSVSDHGIDMEIEFKNDQGQATGKKLYLQLKSGDSHLTTRKRDGAEFFTIKEPRHVGYWMNQAFPVFLMIRASSGETRWMEIRDTLKRLTPNDSEPIRQIEFTGERFDVMSVRRWRDKVLGLTA